MPANNASSLSVEYVDIDALALNPRNPRQHSERQIKQIGRSICRFGFLVPPIVDGAGRVLVGHGRILAGKSVGMTRVPVIRVDSLTDAQAQAFAIADNRLAECATWDERLLGEIFRDLSALELDFSLEETGFSMAEIDLRIEGLTLSEEAAPDPADEVAVGAAPAVTKVGDLWRLGARHRLLCGDALEPVSYKTLMEHRLADMVFTDPPYDLPIRHISGKGAVKHREFAMASGEMSSGQFTYFLATVMHLLARHSKKGSLHYHCMDFRHMLEILTAGNQAYTELKNLIVWVKSNGGMGSFYRSQHELIFLFKSGRGAHRNNINLGVHGRNRTNVWHYAGANTIGRHTDEGNLLAIHPTVKPVALVADAILDCTARGDLVLDPFLGSGSTLIAAERVGRTCCAIELDPLYVDAAARRWQRYTGAQAVHAESGLTFDQCADERRG